MSKWNTYLFEIIYPSNRIVVDYDGKEGLVLLSANDNNFGTEYSYDVLLDFSKKMGVELTERHEFENFEDLFEAREMLSQNEEGFVITFENGFKFKLKGEEYCKLHRALFNMTPLAFWDIYDFEKMCIPQDFLEQFPEEFEDQVNEIMDQIHESYFVVSVTIQRIAAELPKFVDRKSLYMHLTQFYDGLQCPILNVVDGKSLERWVKKVVRPTSNVYFDVKEWVKEI
jgi:RNA ligase